MSARLEKIIDSGSDKDALAAADMILRRIAPEPKARPDIAAAAAIGAQAGAGHVAQIMSKAAARLSGPVLQGQTVPDATFTPLARVQNGE